MLNDLKDVERLLKFCRKIGVNEITLEGLTVKFGDAPTKAQMQSQADDETKAELSDDDLLYYAVNGGS